MIIFFDIFETRSGSLTLWHLLIFISIQDFFFIFVFILSSLNNYVFIQEKHTAFYSINLYVLM